MFSAHQDVVPVACQVIKRLKGKDSLLKTLIDRGKAIYKAKDVLYIAQREARESEDEVMMRDANNRWEHVHASTHMIS